MFVFFLLKKERIGPKNDKLNFWFLFFGPSMDAHLFLKKMLCWNPYFKSVFGCALFGPSCQQRGNFGHPPKKKKTKKEKMIDSWKAQFLVLLYFCVFLFFGFCFFVFLGSGEVARRATSLGPEPSLFVLFVCFVFCFFLFPFLCSSLKKLFSPQKAFLFIYMSVSLCFSWAFVGLPLVQFVFLCLSLSLSISLSLSCSFLSSCLSYFAFFSFLLFVSFFVFLSSLLLIHEK